MGREADLWLVTLVCFTLLQVEDEARWEMFRSEMAMTTMMVKMEREALHSDWPQ